jgi:hypothetical protein
MKTLRLQKGLRVGSSDSVLSVSRRPAPSWRKGAEEIDLPVHTVGECTGSRHCGQYKTDLANGWCARHWDKGLGST